MLVQNTVNFFAEGYAVNEGASCLDLPIAIAVGSVCEESYNQYLFTLSYLENWGSHRSTWYEERKQILADMNYLFCEYRSNSWQDMLKYIYQVIDEGGYVLMPVSYNALYYYQNHKTSLEHMIMISGYNLEDDILLVNDCNFVRHGLELVKKEYTVYQVALETRGVERIWKNSMAALCKTPGNYCFYGLRQSGEVHLSAPDYIEKFLSFRLTSDDIMRRNSRYREEALRTVTIQKNDARGYISYIRRNYLGWLHPFFDYFKFQKRQDITEKMEEMAGRLYKARDLQLYKIHIRIMRGYGLTENYITGLLEESEAIEDQVACFLRKEYHLT